MKIYRCKLCGQIAVKLKDKHVPLSCCGEEMEEIFPQTKDKEGQEKHLPIYDINENSIYITIGSLPHPMSENHYIEWVILETSKGYYMRSFLPTEQALTLFTINKDESPVAIYSYCNIHGLWKVKIN